MPDLNYITTFGMNGFNNQVLSFFSMLHMVALINSADNPDNLVPVLPPFTPHLGHLFGHEGSHHGLPVAPVLRFSEVFDVDRFAEEVGWGMIEWADLKIGKAGRHGDKVYEDEWQTEEERKKIRKMRPEHEDWPDVWEGREPKPPNTLGCWGQSTRRVQVAGDHLGRF